jgi:hypothetical protein
VGEASGDGSATGVGRVVARAVGSASGVGSAAAISFFDDTTVQPPAVAPFENRNVRILNEVRTVFVRSEHNHIQVGVEDRVLVIAPERRA